MEPLKKKLKAMVITFAWEIFTDTSSSDEEDEEEPQQEELEVECSGGSVEEKPRKIAKPPPADDAVIAFQSMTDETFKRHFRMSHSTFEAIERRLQAYFNAEGDNINCLSVGTRTMLMIVLYLLGCLESYRSVGRRFKLSKSTVYRSLVKVVNAVLAINYQDQIITWPQPIRAQAIIQAYQEKHGFPGTVGAIDNCHVEVRTTSGSYKNKSKVESSIVLQAVCDVDSNFIDCFTGEVGSLDKADVLERSPLYGMIDSREILREDDHHIIADQSYPLTNHLLVPFSSTARLTVKQQRFNQRITSANSSVRRALSMLKGRFSRLRCLDMNIAEFVPNVLMACCVLHNMCQREGDTFEMLDEEENDYEREVVENFSGSFQGQIKRDRIANRM